jgi:hypothetical protein
LKVVWEALEVFLDTAIRVPDSPYRDPIAGIIRLPSLCQVRKGSGGVD